MTAALTEIDARTEHRSFYVAMALLLIAASIGGFGMGYIAPVVAGSSPHPPIVHLHALVASAWLVLFLVQAIFIARGAVERHQALGMLGIALATAVAFSGVMVAVQTMRIGIHVGAEASAKTFAVFPLTIVLLFVGFFAAAIANIARPALHKRLMLIASIMIMPPATGRIVGQFVLQNPSRHQILGETLPAPLPAGTIASLSADVLLLIAIAYDWRTRGRPHPIYLYSLAIILAVQVLRLPLSQTKFWGGLMDAMLTF